MNILLINHYAGSSRHGMEYRPFYLAREWVRMGHRVTIAAASRSHLRTEEPSVNGATSEEMIDGIRYLWLKTPGYAGNGVRRVRNMVRFGQRLGRQHWDGAPDVVIASSPHPLIIWPAAKIARRAEAKLVFEVRDLWPLTLIELGRMGPRHPLVWLLQRAEDFAYRHADQVVSLLPKAEPYMLEHGLPAGRFAYVPNGVDTVQWQEGAAPLPEPHRETLDRLKQGGRFLVGYAGAHGLANALNVVLGAAEQLRERPVTFVLVGQGPEKEALRKTARQKSLDNIVFLPPVPRGAVADLLRAMDVLYLGLQRMRIYRFGISPNKLLDYMMAGKPVIHAVDAGNDLVAESGCGISCPPEDPQALAEAVVQLMQQPASQREALGRQGRDYVMQHHDYAVLARRFLEVTDVW